MGRRGSGDRWVWMLRIVNTAFLKEWVMLRLLVGGGVMGICYPIYELVVRVLKMGLFCFTLKHKRLHKSQTENLQKFHIQPAIYKLACSSSQCHGGDMSYSELLMCVLSHAQLVTQAL